MTTSQLNSATDGFVARWTGHHDSVDGAYPKDNPFQCWDIGARFCMEVVNCSTLPTRPGGNGGAVDCFRYFLSPLPSFFVRIPYGQLRARKGDLVVWNENVGGGSGHIGIFIAETSTGFISFDQNWPTGSPAKLVAHNYNNVLGFLRPITKEEEPMITDSDAEYWRWNKLGLEIRNRDLSREEFRKAAVGMTWLRAIEILSDSDEADRAMQMQAIGTVAMANDWAGQIASFQNQLKALQSKVDELSQRPTRDTLEAVQRQLEVFQTASKTANQAIAEPPKISATKATPAPTSESRKVSLFVKLLAALMPKKA